MVAYNFKKRFISPIETGTKVHTIRENGKRRHARPGEAIQLYYGMRTKQCRKIIDDPICTWVMPISMLMGPLSFLSVKVLGIPMDLAAMDDLAVTDGFENAKDMHDFWLTTHGDGVFSGRLIGWSDGKPEALAV